jgi:hypothetical protein
MSRYEYTHITWRKHNDDGSVTTLVNVIPDKEQAADEIKELVTTPGVFALRYIHYGEEAAAPGEQASTEFHLSIGSLVRWDGE